jgi:hypothetical protein
MLFRMMEAARVRKRLRCRHLTVVLMATITFLFVASHYTHAKDNQTNAPPQSAGAGAALGAEDMGAPGGRSQGAAGTGATGMGGGTLAIKKSKANGKVQNGGARK